MSDLPERIWIWRNEPNNELVVSAPDQPYPMGAAEYLHKDIVQSQIDAAVAAERERCTRATVLAGERSAGMSSSYVVDAIAAAIRKGDQP